MTPALLQSSMYGLVLGAYMACATSFQNNASEVAHCFWSSGPDVGDIREDEQLGGRTLGTRKGIAGLFLGVCKLFSFTLPTFSFTLPTFSFTLPTLEPLKQLSVAQSEPQFEVTPVLSSQDV